jgi:hypothetical protein
MPGLLFLGSLQMLGSLFQEVLLNPNPPYNANESSLNFL